MKYDTFDQLINPELVSVSLSYYTGSCFNLTMKVYIMLTG